MSASGSDGLLEFINGDTSGEIPILSVSNPVNWGRLGQSIGTSILATIVVGVTNVIDTVANQVGAILGGLEGFIEGWVSPTRDGLGGQYEQGVIDVLLGGVVSAYSSAFEFSSTQFGILALPVNAAIVLTSVYILSVGLQAAASRAAGGG